MSDPTDVLMPALKAWLETDAGVIAAFAGKPVKVFDDQPPANEKLPYIWLATADPDDDTADCFDGAVVNIGVDVWSLTNPPGRIEARRIAKAVNAALKSTVTDSPALSMAGEQLKAVQVDGARYLTDPSDGKTVHAVIAARLTVDPID